MLSVVRLDRAEPEDDRLEQVGRAPARVQIGRPRAEPDAGEALPLLQLEGGADPLEPEHSRADERRYGRADDVPAARREAGVALDLKQGQLARLVPFDEDADHSPWSPRSPGSIRSTRTRV